MKDFIFDLQRFAEVAISADNSYDLDGVTYTAVSDAVLNLDDGKVSGLASGSVTATITDATDSPTINFDATDSAVNFTATSDGEVISATMVLPLEIISGEFTFDGSTLAISAGSDLAIVNSNDDYSLRNENHFVYDSTYTFSSTTMTSDAQQVNSHFVLSNGTDTRELDLVQLGKVINDFTQRGFTLVQGSSEVMNIGDYTITATAVNDDAGLNISLGADGITLVPNSNDGALNVALTRGDTEIISGELECTSGTITFGYDHAVTFEKDTSFNFTRNGYTLTATTTDKATTAIEFTQDGKITFTPGENDGGLNLLLTQGTKTLFGGELNVSGGTITFDANMQKFSFTEGTEVSVKLAGENPQEFQFKVVGDDASFKVEADGSGTFTITPDSGDGTLDITIKQGDQTIFYNNLSVSSGSITIGNMGQAIGLTAGTSMTVTLGNYTFDITANDDASFGLGVLSDGTIAITPQDNDGSLDISIKRGTSEIFSNTVSISGGTITFNPSTQLMTLTDGTTVTISLNDNNYILTATADGDASSSISIASGGITLTPQTGDGKLKLTLTGTSSGSLSADIEVLSGSFTLSEGGAITVAKDTELEIKFSDDYIINFKATDKAGGTLSLGSDGITFAPSSDEEDGGLQLTVKRGDDTRSASLDVTGSVTYKLDGSISLTKGTVVKNVFDDGNILTITANTKASGSITFNPQTGLTITPKKTNALTVSLTTGDIEVVKITSIDGSITYQNGIVTATDGTKARVSYYFGWESDLYTKGGTASLQFTADRTVYIANEGANFVIDYLDGTTAEIQNGTYSDIYATETSDPIELVSVGSTFRSNDNEQIITLEKAGDYTLNGIDVTTSQDNTQVQMPDYDTVIFTADAGITVSATEDKGFRFKIGDDGTITITTTDSGDFGVSSGSITFGDEQAIIAEGTTISLTTGERVVTFTASKDISVSSKIEDAIYYLTLDEASLNLSITQDDKTILAGEMVIDGVFSYRPETGTFGLTGANSSHGDGNNTSFQFTTQLPDGTSYAFKAETNDTTVVFVPTFSDGKFELNFPNEAKHSMKFTVSKDEQTVFENNVAINGTIGFDTTKQELSLTKDTVLTLTQGDNSIEITALGDAGGKLNIVDGGLRFAPNTGDGELELNFVSANRKANIDVTGAIVFGEDAKISLENGTVVNFTWEDGTNLKLTSKGSTGSIGLDDKGIKITSEDENLTIDLTTATGYSTTVSSIQGTIYYNAGSVIIEEGTSLTGTGSINGQAVDVTLEAQGGDGSLTFGATGMTYAAGTGALKVTLTSSSGEESTFTVNSGSVFIGSSTFKIAEGTDLATDLKDFVPALYFTTSEAGTYTINGQTITTTAENISMTATDDYMTFKTSDDVVTYDGMTFAGNGNVSLSTAGVVLGAGVEADGFGKDKMFILAEAGNVTADARIFELTEEVPTGISVTGAEDGFIFSRTNTEESEARFDDPDPANVGKIFTEEFFLSNDDSYRIQTDLLGLQQIIGVSAPSTLNATATFDGEPETTIFDIVTENEGVFTVGDKNYSISGDDSVAIKTIFNSSVEAARGFDSLNGTVSGDFTAYEVSINGSASAVQPIDDTLISIAADENGFEVSGLDDSSLLRVSATDTYIVNGTTINANAGDYIAGNGENSAYLLAMSDNTVVTGTENADIITNSGTNVTINALGGSDILTNYGAASVTVNGDDGNDAIFNVARVDSETGEVIASPDNVSISGGAGNDYISAEGDNVSINAGAGDDLISLSGGAALVTYAEGDGNDTITGFDSTSTLSVGDNVYSTQVSGNDLIITVGDSKITLIDAANETNPNIESTNGLVQVVEAIEKRTALGYPVIAGLVFNPEEITGPEPTNYATKEDWTITSADNLELYGVHYTPENSNDKWVVLVHGYGCNYESMNPFATFYLANNYNVLMIDQRAAGKSEGTWLTMGVAESQDVALWTQEIASRYPDSKITLHGVSMGAATALLAAARSDVVNVTSIVEDCGYSDVMKTFETIVADHPELAALGISSEIIPLIDPVAEGLTGYYLHDAAPIDSIATVKKPTLFISGDDDGVAPVSMLHELYDESGAEAKEKFIVKGAGHARSGLIKPLEYSNAVFRFVSEANGEGWDTENIAENISLRGTKYNDTLSNSAEGVTINGEAGDDYISNTADNVSIFGGEGNDTIYNHADNITIDAGLGNNSISNNSDNVVFVWSGGDDTIEGFKEDSVLQIAGTKYSTKKSGDDVIVTVGDDEIVLTGAASLDAVQIIDTNPTVISNTADDTLIIGTGGDDSITNSGDNVTIRVYGGDDTVNNTGAHAVIDGSDGADSISNYSPTGSLIANGVSINAGAGNDTIQNHHAYYVTLEGGSGDDHISVFIGNQTYIDGGSGNDTILGETVDGISNWAMGGYATINGGDGDDYINPIFSDSASIMGGDGNDTIINEGDEATINGGAGDDVISLQGASLNNEVIKYDVGSGNDSIFGFNETSQLSITAGTNYETQISGDDVLVTVGEDILTIAGGENVLTIVGGASLSTINIVNYEVPALNISNSTNNTLITGTELADTIQNTGSNVTISGRASNDSIISSGAKGSLDGGAGNDTINNSGANAMVEGYYGDDRLTNSGEGVSISGNYGNDTIINRGDNVTISGGSGSDSIVNTGSNVLIEFIGGQDSVWGFNATSKLKTAEGATSVRADGDIIVTVGDDKLTLVDAASVVPEEIVLTEKGTTTIDGKVFELTKNVSRGVTIASVEDGFTSGITNSDGSIFVEKFIAKGDDSYNVQIDSKGLQTISGIDAGATVSTSATKEGESVANQVYIVTEDAGSYTFNDINITTNKDNAEIRLVNDALSFKAADVPEYDGKTFSGDGSVAVSVDSVVLGASISATGFDSGDSFVLAQKGSTTVDGRVFGLTEDIPDGISITGANNDYTFSHKITQKDATLNNVPDSYIGKTFSENVIVAGDETYSLQADTLGLRRVRGISDSATVNGGDTSIDGDYNDKYAGSGQYFYVDTDTEGTFTIGEKAYSISGDSNVEIVADFLREKSYASGFASLDGTVSGDFTSDEFYVNGSKNPILIYGDDSIKVVGSASGTKLLDVSDGASIVYAGGVKEVHTDTEGTFTFGEDNNTVAVTIQGDDNVTFELNSAEYIENIADVQGDLIFSYTSDNLFINGIGGYFDGTFSSIGAYDNALYIHDITNGSSFKTGDADKIWLQMLGENFTLNNNNLALTNDADGIWLRNKEIVGLDEGASLKVSEGGTYIANETSLKATSGDVIVGLDGDAYIYNADNPLITRMTPTAQIVNTFKLKNYSVVSASATAERNISLSGGDLAVIENTSAPVNITAGDDTIVSRGENVNVSLTGGNTWLFPIEGRMTLENYDHSTGTGFGTTYNDIFTAVTNGSINFNNGNLWLGSAQVDMGNNSELINFYDRVGKLQKVGYASQHDSLDVSNETKNLILVAKQHGTIISGSGKDSLYANEGSFVDGGAGSNVVRTEGSANIVLSGRTTVENFHTGFGSGTDTIYIAGDPAGVEFLENGLTFGNSSDTVTLSDIKTTAKVNIFHERRNVLNKGVFIAAGDWYKAENSDLAVNEGEEVYFVGTAANTKAGVDFSGITGDLNVTMDTAYIDSKDYVPTTMWVNGVYSLKGGAGNTTIIGSDKNDTILAGSGEQSISGGVGQDKMFGNTDADKNVATFFYTPGDGRDSIENFDFMSDAQDTTADKVKFNDNSAITDVFLKGNDVGIRIDGGKEFLMLEGAQGKSFRLNDDLIAKVDTNAEFDGYTNFYVGIGSKATLTVGKGAGDVEVWLSDDSLDYHGTRYDGNFAILDASQSDGNNILAGNGLSNVITGGSGSNSVWGGYGSESDTLIGGAGQNTFFYGAGNGNDNIQNAHDGDIISLEDITLDQIADANITNGGVIFKFTDGGSLTVDGTADVTYQLADGSKHSANHATHDWDSK